MKKFLIIAMLGLSGIVSAATATFTPTITPTFTATPGPFKPINTSLQRQRLSPRFNVTTDDGVNTPGLTPLTGNGSWYSQVANQSVLNMGTETASVRWAWEVPANITTGNINGIQAYI